jgi:hypothetical protein
MIHLVTWLLVAVFHTALLAILLLALFLSGTSGEDIYKYALALGAHLGLQVGWQVLSFFGVSGFACLSGYAFFVKKHAVNFATSYLWKNIVAQKIQ